MGAVNEFNKPAYVKPETEILRLLIEHDIKVDSWPLWLCRAVIGRIDRPEFNAINQTCLRERASKRTAATAIKSVVSYD